jgi:hypothetical protein
MKEVKGRWL